MENSLAVRIPQHIAQGILLTEGVEIDLEIISGSLVIKPRIHKQYSLNGLIATSTPQNLPIEVDAPSHQSHWYF
jgi:antitoxin MazE